MRAFALFVICTIIFSGCSKPSADEYFQQAELAVKSSKIDEAIQLYRKIVDEYPKSEKAEAAQFILASLYQNNTHQYQQAINEYWKYYELFPDAKQTPTALFLIGFLYNNELKIIDSAATAYKLFLEKYPSHEMALSAQFELEHLGEEPEAMLPAEEAKKEKSTVVKK